MLVRKGSNADFQLHAKTKRVHQPAAAHTRWPWHAPCCSAALRQRQPRRCCGGTAPPARLGRYRSTTAQAPAARPAFSRHGIPPF